MNTSDTSAQSKPINLRIIFILNLLKICLSIGLFIGFKYHGLTIGTMSSASSADLILYTTICYVITFAVMVISILKRWTLFARLAIAADVIVSLPAKAFIGILIAVISMSLTFTASVRRYFAWRTTGGARYSASGK